MSLQQLKQERMYTFNNKPPAIPKEAIEDLHKTHPQETIIKHILIDRPDPQSWDKYHRMHASYETLVKEEHIQAQDDQTCLKAFNNHLIERISSYNSAYKAYGELIETKNMVLNAKDSLSLAIKSLDMLRNLNKKTQKTQNNLTFYLPFFSKILTNFGRIT